MQQTTSPSTFWIRLFPIGLILVGAAVLAAALTARFTGVASLSQLSANQAALGLAGLLVMLTGGTLSVSREARLGGEWLVVGGSALAATLAADVFVLGGTLDLAIEALVLLAAFGSLLLISLVPPGEDVLGCLRAWARTVAHERLAFLRGGLVVVQLVLLATVMSQFQLESQVVYHNVMLLALFGFVLNLVVPMRYRLAFFALLSLSALAGILGLSNAIWVLGIGLLLIGLSHLPVAFRWRVAILLVVGAALMLLRGAYIPNPVPIAIWPILGSMFMFRLIIYVYDLKFSKKPVNFAHTLSYFFMFPNIVFPFFPIVDHSTMARTYYNDKDALNIYQTGVQWIFRGVVHLVLYRIVNYYVMLAPEQVTNTSQLVQLVISNYLLYLRVSGQFHLITGLLKLFGFNLPVTNYLYFLASSFTDLWRRVNIYWKDFMQKIFFYPVHFRMKRWGSQAALMGATVFVIFMTWLLHGYQWFWLRGSTFFVPTDMLFWTILGLLLMINVAYETRKGRKRTLGGKQRTPREYATLTLRTTATFTTIAVLWSLWTSPRVADWLALWSVALSLEGILTLLLSFGVLLLVFALSIWIFEPRSKVSPLAKPTTAQLLRPGFLNVGLLVVLYIVTLPSVYSRLGAPVEAFVSDVTVARLSDRDAELMQQGYYENLMGVDRFNPDLWQIYTKRPTDWPLLQETEAAEMTRDFSLIRLTPDTSIMFHGSQFSVNSWGMRDKEYDLVAAPGTYRIALLGPSYVMGSGVADEETFDWQLEERLNAALTTGGPTQYEVLNFGVAGYSVMEELWRLQDQALAFEPDVVLLIAHHLEEEVATRNLANSARNGVEIPYSALVDFVTAAGVTPGMTQSEAERLLKPYGPEIVQWAYAEIAATAEANNLEVVYVYMPTPELGVPEGTVAQLTEWATAAGFNVLNLADAYDGHNLDDLIVASWDRHPNAEGHRLLSEALYAGLAELNIVPAVR